MKKAGLLRSLGAEPVVVGVFDAAAMARAVKDAKPDAVIHQQSALRAGHPRYDEGLECNAKLRIDGTHNLIAAANAAAVRRLIAQSIAFVYAPKQGSLIEDDQLAIGAPGMLGRTVEGVQALESATLAMQEGIVLRYGRAPGRRTNRRVYPACTSMRLRRPRCSHSARASRAFTTSPTPGLSSEKAKRELGFDARFRF